MHADLHPGNIMVDTKYRNKGPIRMLFTKEKQLTVYDTDLGRQHILRKDVLTAMDESLIDELRITLVDAGMVVKLTDEESSAFIGLLSSLGEGNGDEAAEYTLRFSLERNRMTIAEKRYFVADMVLLFQECCRGYGTDVDVGQVLRGILTLIRKHRVRIDANFATLVINCLCIESLARRVCPSYNVLDAGRPLLQGYRRFVDQKDRARPIASPWFALRMFINALKKDIDDRLFFRQRAKHKVAIYQTVEKLLQK
jgi:predicted unusual protein kinase regulating ubiquinone biosynthesis (AarF/ABC1/UbiB family)